MNCLIALIPATVLTSCMGGCQNGAKGTDQPVQSQFIGKTEDALLKEHGQPTETHLCKNWKELIGEMRTFVAREAGKLDPNANLGIKELIFVRKNTTRFIWLMKIDGVWTAFYDLDVPKGVQY